jgi:hypothetical protein
MSRKRRTVSDVSMLPLDQNKLKLLPLTIQKNYFHNEYMVGRYGVAGDGSCFFHSVCAALNKDDYLFKTNTVQRKMGHKFRCAFTKELTADKWDQFIKSNNITTDTTVEEAREHFCNNKKWANEIMIKYVIHNLKTNIIFIDGVNTKIYCGVKGRSDEPLIIIMWISRTHFEPLVRVLGQGAADTDAENKVAVQMLFNSLKDENFITHILNQYQSQCQA